MWWLPRFMKKNKGSISLFMAIIMLSMFVISAVINDGARLRAARTLVQSAADSAAMSVLAKYDKNLKDRYGLFALEEADAEAVIDDFNTFFAANLSAEFPLDSDFSTSIQNFLGQVTGNPTAAAEWLGKTDDAFDLYDFDVENSSVDLVYSIIEPQVLQTQMAEFTKYRGFISMANVIDLSELTEKAQESSDELSKISATVDNSNSSTNSGDGEGYKVYVQDATRAYYELSQRLRSINYAVYMDPNTEQQFAAGVIARDPEWSVLTIPDDNIQSQLDNISGKLTPLENKAENEIKPALEEYERLKDDRDAKQETFNAAQTALNAAETNKNNADSAEAAAADNAAKRAEYETYLDNTEILFGSDYNNSPLRDVLDSIVSEYGSNYSGAKDVMLTELAVYINYKSGTTGGWTLNNVTLADLRDYRLGTKSSTSVSIPKIGIYSSDPEYSKINDAYSCVIDALEDWIKDLGDTDGAYNTAKSNQNAANTAYNNAKSGYEDAQAALDEANRKLNEQMRVLDELRSRWNADVGIAFDNGLLGTDIVTHIDNISDVINNDTLKYAGFYGSEEEFANYGMKGAINDTRVSLSDAKNKLTEAKNKTDEYKNYLETSSNRAYQDENAIEYALYEDAKTAFAELEFIESQSLGIDSWLDSNNDYADDINSKIEQLRTLWEKWSDYMGNSGSLDSYQYLSNSIDYAIEYNDHFNDSFRTVHNGYNELNTDYNDTYYNKYYTYKSKIEEEADAETSSTAGNIFTLFKGFDLSSFKNDSDSGSNHNQVITSDDKDILPSTKYKNDTELKYHTSDKWQSADQEYIDDVVDGYDTSGIDPEPVDNTSQDVSTDGLSGLDFGDGEDSSKQTQSFNILQEFMDNIGNFANSMTNSLLVNFYTMSTFKSRVSKPADEWEEFYKEKGVLDDLKAGSERNDPLPYDMQRYDDANKEMNLNFVEKDSDDETFFHSEIEYILRGSESEKTNENNIYLKIYGIRMVNNLIAMYKDTEIRNLASLASTWAGPFAPLVQIAIIAVLAALETYFDMEFLIKYGYQIAFWKNSSQLTLSLKNIKCKFKNIEPEQLEDPMGLINSFANTPNNVPKNGLKVSYETYLWFFMLLTGKEDKLLRSADLMQLNIRKTDDSDYIMADHYTYVRCYSDAKVKPLFISLAFMPDDIKGYDRDDNYHVKSLNYQGY